MNDRIRVSPVQVVNQDGEMLGEMVTSEALQLAVDAELDLVEVGPDSRPPVCRIMDFGKVQYERQKKQGKGSGAKHRVQLKQIRLRAKTGQHDIDFKIRKAREFLRHRHKVKINVLFRGRENAHHDRGRELLNKVVETLEDVASIEQPVKMEGRRMMSVLLSPQSGSHTAKTSAAS